MKLEFRDNIMNKIMHGERLNLRELHNIEEGLTLLAMYEGMLDNCLDLDEGEYDELYQLKTKSLKKWTDNHKKDESTPCRSCSDTHGCRKDAFSCAKVFEWWENNRCSEE